MKIFNVTINKKINSEDKQQKLAFTTEENMPFYIYRELNWGPWFLELPKNKHIELDTTNLDEAVYKAKTIANRELCFFIDK